MFAANVRAPYYLVAAFAPGMAARGRGSIINIGSMAGTVGLAGGAAYGATKAAIAALTRSWAAEYSASGVRVNTVAPGPVYTRPEARDLFDTLAATTAAKRAADPAEIAEVVAFLASQGELHHGRDPGCRRRPYRHLDVAPVAARFVPRGSAAPSPTLAPGLTPPRKRNKVNQHYADNGRPAILGVIVSLALHWYLPTHGDGRTLLQAGSVTHARGENPRGGASRPATLEYLSQVARAAEQSGFDAALTPTGTFCDDAWITTAALMATVHRLRFLVAFRPGSISPTLAAQQAMTFQRHSNDRLLLNIVTGGDDLEMRRYGDGLSKDQRYERTDEFLTILRGAWSGEPFHFHGEHLWTDGALAPGGELAPEIYFGGSSDAALRVAARHADVYLTWGDPPPALAPHLDRVRALADDENRELRFGVRLHVIPRDTEQEAWAAADALIADADDQTIAAVQERLSRASAVGQQRMASLHGGRRDRLEVYPNLWAGVGLLRAGAGTALVGSHEQIADRISEYHELGITEFIFSGYPHVEEAYAFGEGVLPILRERGLVREQGTRQLSSDSNHWTR